MACIGDVIKGKLYPQDGITPKVGDLFRNKMLIILGNNDDGTVVCGVVINTEPRLNLCTQYPISANVYTFLSYNSFVNCDNLVILQSDRVSSFSTLGSINNSDLELIRSTVISSRVVKGKLKKKFSLFTEFSEEDV